MNCPSEWMGIDSEDCGDDDSPFFPLLFSITREEESFFDLF